MKLEEAIKRLKRFALPSWSKEDHADNEAVRLGIEALKRHSYGDRITYNDYLTPLPGETEE